MYICSLLNICHAFLSSKKQSVLLHISHFKCTLTRFHKKRKKNKSKVATNHESHSQTEVTTVVATPSSSLVKGK